MKEKGTSLVWLALTIFIVMGILAIVIDIGILQNYRVQMQTAADAAALAGARKLPYENNAYQAAIDMMAFYDIKNGEGGVEVECVRNPDGVHSSWYKVQITKTSELYFAPAAFDTKIAKVQVSATASYISSLPLYISSSLSQYGTNGIQNLSCFGPYSRYTYGDAYSTLYLDDGTDNSRYNPLGYNFLVNVKPDYFTKNGTNDIVFQVFDPDCWNIGNAQDAGPGKVDEIRDSPPAVHNPSSKYTSTRYQLFAPDSTPVNYDDDSLIAEAIWTPGMIASDMEWTTPTGWSLNLGVYGYGSYRINVKTIGGSSENGFNLRAGSPEACYGTWFPNNGTEIMAIGVLPINFNQSGVIAIDLGYIPPEAGGSTVFVTKFDTDVGAKSILYSDTLGHTWSGTLAGNGTFKTDQLTIPSGYAGSKLKAEFTSGAQDTSSWSLAFDGQLSWLPGELRLID